MFELLIIFVCGLLIGYLVAYTIYGKRYSADQYVLREMFDDEKNQVAKLQEEKVILSSEIAKHEEMIANHEIKLKEEKDSIKKQYEQMKNQFENLANEILDKKSEKFIKVINIRKSHTNY